MKNKIILIIMLLSMIAARGENWTNYPAATYPGIITGDWTFLLGSASARTNNQMTPSMFLQIAKTNTLAQIASGSQAGALSSSDWTTFNGKQAALGYTPPTNTVLGLSNVFKFMPQPTNANLATWATRTVDGSTIIDTAGVLSAPGGGSGDVVKANFNHFTGPSNTFDGPIYGSDLRLSGTNYVDELDATLVKGNGSGMTNLIHGPTVSAGANITVTLSQNADGSTNSQIASTGGGGGSSASVLFSSWQSININASDIRWVEWGGVSGGNLGGMPSMPTGVASRNLTNCVINFTASNGDPLGAGTNVTFTVYTNGVLEGTIAILNGGMTTTNSGTATAILPANSSWAVGVANGSSSQNISGFVLSISAELK